MSELCASFGISRKTGYKWAVRWAEEGKAGLRDRSRAPRSQPGRTERRCEQALLEARQRRPAWGPRKLLVRLASEHPSWPWPAA
ncbi:MAG TPA: leucine zipper domain-containing protein, partial [Thermoanaerobaculia bacterium]|nr:leucine zipper domain-containing protein [Thermoanaerobaculia bacterium]